MVWWIRTLQIADKDGKPTGGWRLTATSDEDGGGPYGLCGHKHVSPRAAENCSEAKEKAKRY